MKGDRRWILLGLFAAGLGAAAWRWHPPWQSLAARGQDGEAVASITEPPAGPLTITALGRLEPKDGIMEIAGPSQGSAVIAELRVREGDTVQPGQVLAVLDSNIGADATAARLRAELEHAEAELARQESLFQRGIASVSARDELRTRVSVAKARLRQAQAALDQTVVRSPIGGQVLKVNAHPGERVGPEGVAELGNTAEMYAVAEVYETDVGGIHPGLRATIKSPALATPANGTVERVGMMIGKRDVLDTDPAADADARVVEVYIRLDDSTRVAALTNLQVEVFIEPAGGSGP